MPYSGFSAERAFLVILLGLLCVDADDASQRYAQGPPRYIFAGYGNATEARQICKKYKGLPMPKTAVEQETLQKAIDAALDAGNLSHTWPNTTIWIGGRWVVGRQNDGNQQRGLWQWDDGTAVGLHSAAAVKLAHMVSSAEEGHSSEPWMCRMLDGVWKDSEGNWKFGIFCEEERKLEPYRKLLRPIDYGTALAAAASPVIVTTVLTTTTVVTTKTVAPVTSSTLPATPAVWMRNTVPPVTLTSSTTNTVIQQQKRDEALVGGLVGGAVGAVGVGLLGGLLGERMSTTGPAILSPTMAPLLSHLQESTVAPKRTMMHKEIGHTGQNWWMLSACFLLPLLVAGIACLFMKKPKNSRNHRGLIMDAMDEESQSASQSPVGSPMRKPLINDLASGSSSPVASTRASKAAPQPVQMQRPPAMPVQMQRLQSGVVRLQSNPVVVHQLQALPVVVDPDAAFNAIDTNHVVDPDARFNAMSQEEFNAAMCAPQPVVKKFLAGPLGFHAVDGIVDVVHTGGQADQRGVQPGWIIKSVNGNAYTKELLHAAVDSGEPYSVSFEDVEGNSFDFWE